MEFLKPHCSSSPPWDVYSLEKDTRCQASVPGQEWGLLVVVGHLPCFSFQGLEPVGLRMPALESMVEVMVKVTVVF
jgi:hypothetical protein